MLKIGTPAPDFTTCLASGEMFVLSQHRGQNVVIFFYVMDFTPGCRAQIITFRDSYDQFTAKDTAIIGISPSTPSRAGEFADANRVPFPIGGDPTAQIRRLYGVKRPFGLGTSRATYVIDPQGIIRGVFHNEIMMGSHTRNALKTVDAIGALERTLSA